MAQGKINSITIVSQDVDQYDWFCRKYSNNWLECWRWTAVQTVSFTAGGGAYRANISFKLPELVGNIWYISATPVGDNTIYWNRVVSINIQRPNVTVVAERSDAVTSVPVKYALYLIGQYS